MQKISFYPVQTAYGSKTRYEWFKKNIKVDDKVVDIGCGTGVMITIPLLQEGFNVLGLDLDQKSIEYGKKILHESSINSDFLSCKNFSEISCSPTKIILSEVLEHLNDQQLDELLQLVRRKLKEGGQLLITVPNGYGWFEMESFLWYKLKLGKLIGFLKLDEYYIIFKNKVLGFNTVFNHPSSLDTSPHVQRFTYFSLAKKLERYGFKIKEIQGGSFFSGPFSNLLFTGFDLPMRVNMYLGRTFPFLAADFYMRAEK